MVERNFLVFPAHFPMFPSDILPYSTHDSTHSTREAKITKHMKYPTTRFVFDRKKVATRQKEAAIQVEVLLSGKKKYISTGVKVYKDQWTEKSHIVSRNDMYELNERIDMFKKTIDDYITDLVKKRRPFLWDDFERFLSNADARKDTFIAYIERRISERTDISESSKKNQRKLLNSLLEYGRIVNFSDLTKSNIASYYEWLLGLEIPKKDKDGKDVMTRMAVPTAWGYMKTLRTYIHDAMLHELIATDPSFGIKVRRGEPAVYKWLTEQEVEDIYKADMPTYHLKKVRDIFVFMCETGMAYSDAMKFDPAKVVETKDGIYTYGAERTKTGISFFFVLTQRALDILNTYEGRLPRMSNQQFNLALKTISSEVKIDKDISSHWARRSCGYRLLNNGMPIEIVAKVLGHKSVRTTETAYAKILNNTVINAYREHIL